MPAPQHFVILTFVLLPLQLKFSLTHHQPSAGAFWQRSSQHVPRYRKGPHPNLETKTRGARAVCVFVIESSKTSNSLMCCLSSPTSLSLKLEKTRDPTTSFCSAPAPSDQNITSPLSPTHGARSAYDQVGHPPSLSDRGEPPSQEEPAGAVRQLHPHPHLPTPHLHHRPAEQLRADSSGLNPAPSADVWCGCMYVCCVNYIQHNV